jgi:hypothetical protein
MTRKRLADSGVLSLPMNVETSGLTLENCVSRSVSLARALAERALKLVEWFLSPR